MMHKYGQAEYAYGILRQISEKLLAEGILTEEQLKPVSYTHLTLPTIA